MRVKFNQPYLTSHEIKYIQDAIQRNKISGDGFYSKQVNAFLENNYQIQKALFVNSGTAALDMSALLLDLGPDDEVIMPSFTFVSTANAILLRGATIKFIDIESQTLNLDPTLLENLITPHTKAIYPVHYAGISCDMDQLMKIAAEHNLAVVEDAAQGVHAKYNNQYLGSIGDIGAYSFHETKNYVCGEGGALLLNNDNYLDRAEIIWEKGTNRRQFFRGEVDKYTWVDLGSSYLGSDLLAAFLYAQLEHIDEITQLRKKAFNYYLERLQPLAENQKLQLPGLPEYATLNYHIFYIILPHNQIRNNLMDFLKKRKISAIFHYIPLHSSPMGLKLGNKADDLPITTEIAGRILRLPLHAHLTQDQLKFVVDSISQFFQETG
jgi:dTDP-4-amino-4,6-dideoxygalactose transaminase